MTEVYNLSSVKLYVSNCIVTIEIQLVYCSLVCINLYVSNKNIQFVIYELIVTVWYIL